MFIYHFQAVSPNVHHGATGSDIFAGGWREASDYYSLPVASGHLGGGVPTTYHEGRQTVGRDSAS